MNRENIKALRTLLEEVMVILETNDSNLAWSGYDSEEEIIGELRDHIEKLEANELSTIAEIKLLFAPTSSLQDIAIQSGWGEDFLAISSKVDGLVEKE
ncbi:MAG: hypothetical protein ACXAEI_15710 [Candidatus Hodarchaeales archaeon]|jgi:hypothetical protein